jgi:hypothetical protein
MISWALLFKADFQTPTMKIKKVNFRKFIDANATVVSYIIAVWLFWILAMRDNFVEVEIVMKERGLRFLRRFTKMESGYTRTDQNLPL